MSVAEVSGWLEAACAERATKKLEWLIPMLIVEVQAELPCLNPSETCFCLRCQVYGEQAEPLPYCASRGRICSTCDARHTLWLNV